MFFIISFYLSITYYRCWGSATKGENLTKLTASVEITQKSHQHHNPMGSPLLLMKCQCRKNGSLSPRIMEMAHELLFQFPKILFNAKIKVFSSTCLVQR